MCDWWYRGTTVLWGVERLCCKRQKRSIIKRMNLWGAAERGTPCGSPVRSAFIYTKLVVLRNCWECIVTSIRRDISYWTPTWIALQLKWSADMRSAMMLYIGSRARLGWNSRSSPCLIYGTRRSMRPMPLQPICVLTVRNLLELAGHRYDVVQLFSIMEKDVTLVLIKSNELNRIGLQLNLPYIPRSDFLKNVTV